MQATVEDRFVKPSIFGEGIKMTNYEHLARETADRLKFLGEPLNENQIALLTKVFQFNLEQNRQLLVELDVLKKRCDEQGDCLLTLGLHPCSTIEEAKEFNRRQQELQEKAENCGSDCYWRLK